MKDAQPDESVTTNEPDSMADAGMTDNPAEMFATDDGAATNQDGEPAKADPNPTESGTGDADEPSTDNKPTISKGKSKGKSKDAATAKADTTPAPEPKILTFRGERLTAEQLADRIRANPELAEDLTQTYAQFPTIQRKHIEALEAMRAAAAQPAGTKPAGDGQAADGQPVQGAPMDPAKALKVFQEGLAPRVQQLVDRGLLSADTVEVNPDLALLSAYTVERLERFGQHQAEVERVWSTLLLPMFQAAEQSYTSNIQRERDAKLDERLKALAGTHQALSPLAEPETRTAYLRHLRATVKADDEQMDERFLSGQFLAFQADPVLQAMAAVSEVRDKAAKRDARASAGESSGPTGRPTAKSNQDILDLFATGG
jgi:hypothetical protein